MKPETRAEGARCLSALRTAWLLCGRAHAPRQRGLQRAEDGGALARSLRRDSAKSGSSPGGKAPSCLRPLVPLHATQLVKPPSAPRSWRSRLTACAPLTLLLDSHPRLIYLPAGRRRTTTKGSVLQAVRHRSSPYPRATASSIDCRMWKRPLPGQREED